MKDIYIKEFDCMGKQSDIIMTCDQKLLEIFDKETLKRLLKTQIENEKYEEAKVIKKYINRLLIIEISNLYDIKLYFVEKDDIYCEANGEESYIDQCYVAGGLNCIEKRCLPDIWVGIFEDPELMLAGFFHELGHLFDTVEYGKSDIPDEDWKYENEKRAWKIGFEKAEEFGIEFGKKAKKWGDEKLKTYEGWYEREVRT